MGSENQVVVKRVFRADRETVFKAFTDPEIMSQWFFVEEGWSADATNKLEVGGRYRIEMRDPDGNLHVCGGEYREITPPEKLVFTWNSPLVQHTLVTVTLREVGDHTEVTLTHELLPTDEMRHEHRRGWGGCFDNLEKALSQSSGTF